MSNHTDIRRIVDISGHKLEQGSSPFIIAEVGINHNGELEKAKEMVRVAKAAGVDVVKFQTFKAKEFVSDPTQEFTYKSQGKEVTESMLEMFQRNELSDDEWKSLKAYCDDQDMVFMSTPQNLSDLDFLIQFDLPAIKVGSDDFTNIPLLRSYAKKNIPMIVSCGMSDLSETYQALEAIGTFEGFPTILLLCTSEYPTPPESVNIMKLKSLEASFPGLVLGFSDHTQGSTAAIMAVAMGATVFETHFTLDHNLPGPDHWFSKNPDELAQWCGSIRDAYKMKGTALVRPTKQELITKKEAQRKIVALKNIKKGELLSTDNIGMKRVSEGEGLSPSLYDSLIGKPANQAYCSGDKIVLLAPVSS